MRYYECSVVVVCGARTTTATSTASGDNCLRAHRLGRDGEEGKGGIGGGGSYSGGCGGGGGGVLISGSCEDVNGKLDHVVTGFCYSISRYKNGQWLILIIIISIIITILVVPACLLCQQWWFCNWMMQRRKCSIMSGSCAHEFVLSCVFSWNRTQPLSKPDRRPCSPQLCRPRVEV